MSVYPGDVFLAKVPYVKNIPEGYNQTIPFKKRPVIVVSSKEFNSKESTIVIVPLSSRIDRIDNYDVHITTKDSIKCGLIKESVARPSIIMAIGRKRVEGILGKAPQPLMTKIHNQILKILGQPTT